MNSLLDHLLVLDLADETAFYCSKLLCQLGANVIKIEKPGGDIESRTDFTWSETERIILLYQNSGKKDITLNLESSTGRDIFRKLATQADIIVETFPPGYLKRRRLDYDRLAALNERLIMVSITPFGLAGPRKSWKADDVIISAASGLTSLHGEPQGPPLTPVGNQASTLSSLFALGGILLAVRNRNITGKGQFIDLSQQEAAASALINPFLRYYSEGIITRRNGRMRWDNMAGIFPCCDGFIFLTFDREWDTIMDIMASDEFDSGLDSPLWQDPAYRSQHSLEIIEVLSRWTRTYRVAQLFELGQSMRFPWAPVRDMASWSENPQLKSRGFIVGREIDGIVNYIPAPLVPFIIDGKRPGASTGISKAGEQNREVYSRMLSLSEEEINRLQDNNVV